MECYDLQCFCCTTPRDMAICEEVPSQRSYQRLVYYNMQWYAGSPQNPLKIELHFGVTTKDTCLLFHIQVLNLFKSWSKLGFGQDSNGQIF